MSKRKARPYHKRWHGDALQGYRRLSLELRGAYTTLLDVMYDHGGPVEERFACVWLDCDARVWKRIRRELVEEHAKIQAFTDAGGVAWLVNKRVQEELALESYAELTRNLAPKFPIATAHVTANSDENHKEHNVPETGKNPELAVLLPLPLPDNSVPPERAPAEPPAQHDRKKESWDLAVVLLTTRGRMREPAARSFFSGLLKKTQVDARDMLPSLLTCEANGTLEPASYLTRAAEGVAKRRGGEQPQAPAPRPEAWKPGTWRAAIQNFIEDGLWGETMGPRPGDPMCRAPPDLLDQFGFRQSA